MEIVTHEINGKKVAEVTSEDVVIANAQDGLELLGNMYYEGYDAILIHAKDIAPGFFDLKTGIR